MIMEIKSVDKREVHWRENDAKARVRMIAQREREMSYRGKLKRKIKQEHGIEFVRADLTNNNRFPLY